MDSMTSSPPDLSGMRILILDEDGLGRARFIEGLHAHGAEVVSASTLPESRGMIARGGRFDAFLASFALLDERPEELITEYLGQNPEGRFLLLIERGMAVREADPSRLLVEDYVQKPADPARVARMLDASWAGGASTALEVADPVIRTARPYFAFRSPAMRTALRDLPRIAASDQTVLISGETGTGKEIISHAIHVMSPRADGPFIAINCGAIPEGLIEGELFGNEKGAFTGAVASRPGKFEAADGGTLLLDEIGDMPLVLQMRLLRVLEDRRIYRVGGTTPRRVDVRVIAATLRDLRREVERGLFREDLYYRLNVLRIALPPLRERVEDISLLAVHFLGRAFHEMRWPPPHPTLATPTIELLERHSWRGNVRELRNVMTRVATLLPEGARQVLPMHVRPHLEEAGTRAEEGTERAGETRAADGVFIPSGTPIDLAEEMLIRHELVRAGGNRSLAARRLGMSIRTLRRRLNSSSADATEPSPLKW